MTRQYETQLETRDNVAPDLFDADGVFRFEADSRALAFSHAETLSSDPGFGTRVTAIRRVGAVRWQEV